MNLTDLITKKIMIFLSSHNEIIIPNFFVCQFEMDIFKINTKNNYVKEYEIKVSKNDFKNDFRKKEFNYKESKNKHDIIKNNEYVANKFSFVCPENLIDIKDIPEKYGLIYLVKNNYNSDNINLNYDFKIIREAKFLHKDKIHDSFYKKIAYKLSFRENQYRVRHWNNKKNYDKLKELEKESEKFSQYKYFHSLYIDLCEKFGYDYNYKKHPNIILNVKFYIINNKKDKIIVDNDVELSHCNEFFYKHFSDLPNSIHGNFRDKNSFLFPYIDENNKKDIELKYKIIKFSEEVIDKKRIHNFELLVVDDKIFKTINKNVNKINIDNFYKKDFIIQYL